jgi:hypothetical protein
MRALLGAFFLLFVAGLVQPAHAAGHIYLLRGFAGIFSTGLDELGEMLTKRGYKATVHSYTEYPGLAEHDHWPLFRCGSCNLDGGGNEKAPCLRRFDRIVCADGSVDDAIERAPSRQLLSGRGADLEDIAVWRPHSEREFDGAFRRQSFQHREDSAIPNASADESKGGRAEALI